MLVVFSSDSQSSGAEVTTKLEGELKRELLIDRQAYTLTISQAGFVLALKGRRKGLEIAWEDLVNGDAAMATALNASLTANIAPKPAKAPTAAKANTKNQRGQRHRTERLGAK
jgi:hypothetical protein